MTGAALDDPLRRRMETPSKHAAKLCKIVSWGLQVRVQRLRTNRLHQTKGGSMSLRIYRSCAGLLVLALLLTGCPERKAVWVSYTQGGPPIFSFGEKVGRLKPVPISLLRVDRCSQSVSAGDSAWSNEIMWMIVAPEDGSSDLETIRYGQVPPRYIETHRARPLNAGCYEVTASAVATAQFVVEPPPAGTID